MKDRIGRWHAAFATLFSHQGRRKRIMPRKGAAHKNLLIRQAAMECLSYLKERVERTRLES